MNFKTKISLSSSMAMAAGTIPAQSGKFSKNLLHLQRLQASLRTKTTC